MTPDTQALIAFILFLGLFGWVGTRRGSISELIFGGVTLVSWVLLQERGAFVVRITNLAGKFLALLQSGKLGSEDPAEAILVVQAAPEVVTDATRDGFLFLVWALLVIIAFIVTSDPNITKKGKSKPLGFLLGVVNGIVLIALLLPRLSSWLATTTGEEATAGSLNVIVAFVGGLWSLFYQTLQNILQRIGPISPSGWLLIITVLLVLVAWPMRGAASKKK
ncbi:MAG TPA: hypothetical protein DCL15_00460 [Chloroflexi bacterium]|nr:hypothetical protein [Chloroflexota bacterium]HHW86013.1 hypothetical protein [Chloroflexota bacterium]